MRSLARARFGGAAHLDLGRVNGVWMGPNRSIVQYHVSAGRTFNWIGISRSSHAAQESWLAEGRVEDALDDYAEIAQRNARLRQKRGADSGEPEQERPYSYDAEAVLHG
jgi:hypothetical protein